MKVSVITATRNRSHALPPLLESIACAVRHAAQPEVEIVIVDNGSTDDTKQVIASWASTNPIRIKQLYEPTVGKGRALNRAFRAANGEIFALIDDDCRVHPNYVTDLLHHSETDGDLVLRGGRVELGDPSDLPYTINTSPEQQQWSLEKNSLRHCGIAGIINGCNMTMRRQLFERLGPYDEDFGPGSIIGSGDDTDYIFRAYLAGITIEYVPDMTVFHHHGRKTAASGFALWRKYMIGSGGLYAKYIFRHPNLCRPFYWDLKMAAKETITRTNRFLPEIGFSYRDKVTYSAYGVFRYVVLRNLSHARQLLRKSDV